MNAVRSNALPSVLIAAASFVLASAAQAHHSFATHYDASKSTQSPRSKRGITMRIFVSTLLFALATSIVALAQAQDSMEQRMKWALAEVVHYDVVAEFSGPTPILHRTEEVPGLWSGASSATVTDRFELAFDLSPAQRAIVGTATFKNFPSTVAANAFEGACQQPPPLTGSYDHVEIVAIKPTFNELELQTKRTFPAGSIPTVNEVNSCSLTPVPAHTDTVAHRLPLLPGTFLATPSAAPQNIAVGEQGGSAPNQVIVGKDGKTMVLDDGQRGWKYTYTLRIVK